MRAGTSALAMATEPTNRKILVEMTTRNVTWPGEGPVAITPGGRQAVFTGSVAERWLAAAPGKALALDSRAGQAALAALIDGWSAAAMHAVAAAPATTDELKAAAAGLPAEATTALLGRMQAAGLLGASGDSGKGALYRPTDQLRTGLAPLLVAARLELGAPQPEMAPLTRLDIEAALQLALPLLRLPEETSGSCALAVELGPGGPGGPVGVTAQVESGRVVACKPGLDKSADARADASAEDWLNTLIEPNTKSVHTTGDRLLAGLLLADLHSKLFA